MPVVERELGMKMSVVVSIPAVAGKEVEMRISGRVGVMARMMGMYLEMESGGMQGGVTEMVTRGMMNTEVAAMPHIPMDEATPNIIM